MIESESAVKNRVNRWLEAASSVFAMAGVFALALHPDHTVLWMWWAWLIADTGFIIWSCRVKAWGVLGLNAVYAVLNLFGLLRFLGFI
jgi:hypothetical protein